MSKFMQIDLIDQCSQILVHDLIKTQYSSHVTKEIFHCTTQKWRQTDSTYPKATQKGFLKAKQSSHCRFKSLQIASLWALEQKQQQVYHYNHHPIWQNHQLPHRADRKDRANAKTSVIFCSLWDCFLFRDQLTRAQCYKTLLVCDEYINCCSYIGMIKAGKPITSSLGFVIRTHPQTSIWNFRCWSTKIQTSHRITHLILNLNGILITLFQCISKLYVDCFVVVIPIISLLSRKLVSLSTILHHNLKSLMQHQRRAPSTLTRTRW